MRSKKSIIYIIPKIIDHVNTAGFVLKSIRKLHILIISTVRLPSPLRQNKRAFLCSVCVRVL